MPNPITNHPIPFVLASSGILFAGGSVITGVVTGALFPFVGTYALISLSGMAITLPIALTPLAIYGVAKVVRKTGSSDNSVFQKHEIRSSTDELIITIYCHPTDDGQLPQDIHNREGESADLDQYAIDNDGKKTEKGKEVANEVKAAVLLSDGYLVELQEGREFDAIEEMFCAKSMDNWKGYWTQEQLTEADYELFHQASLDYHGKSKLTEENLKKKIASIPDSV